jgi:hypothetical protein
MDPLYFKTFLKLFHSRFFYVVEIVYIYTIIKAINNMTKFNFLTKQDEKNIQSMIDQNQSIFDDLTDQQIVAIYLNHKYDYVK